MPAGRSLIHPYNLRLLRRCTVQVGNDFLPPLPTVDINEGGLVAPMAGHACCAALHRLCRPACTLVVASKLQACCMPATRRFSSPPVPSPAGSLDAMFALYKQMLPALGGYLTHAGELSRTRLEAFMAALAEAEADVLQARAEVGERGRLAVRACRRRCCSGLPLLVAQMLPCALLATGMLVAKPTDPRGCLACPPLCDRTRRALSPSAAASVAATSPPGRRRVWTPSVARRSRRGCRARLTRMTRLR